MELISSLPCCIVTIVSPAGCCFGFVLDKRNLHNLSSFSNSKLVKPESFSRIQDHPECLRNSKMNEKEITIAFISDLHYSSTRNLACPERRGEYMPALLAGTVKYLNRTVRPDLVLCGGDLINAPAAEDASRLTGILSSILGLLDMPFLVIRGNHDLLQEKFTRYFPFHAAAEAGFVRIVAFDDPELPGYNAVRTPEDLKRMKQAADGWDGILFSFQHTPLLPPGQCIYGYENAEEILALLKDCGYRGTLSGHYHSGIPLKKEDGLQFLVQNAMCEPPFTGTLLRIGRNGIIAAEPFGCGDHCKSLDLS